MKSPRLTAEAIGLVPSTDRPTVPAEEAPRNGDVVLLVVARRFGLWRGGRMVEPVTLARSTPVDDAFVAADALAAQLGARLFLIGYGRPSATPGALRKRAARAALKPELAL